jgi:hypothetical protein
MKPLPYKYYKDCCEGLAKCLMQAKYDPIRQQKRIDTVLESGLDYELMRGGNGHSWEIPLYKLYEFLEEAKAVDVEKIKENYLYFKSEYIGIKNWVGDLRAAKIEAELKKLKHPNYFDEKYNFYNSLIERYMLNRVQSEKLMNYFLKIELV